MPEFVTVAKVGAIPEGTGASFPVGNKLVAVFNLGGGLYQAINDLCPHMGASLADGPLENGIVACPWHAWRFRVSDGTWCDNPRIKTDTFEVRVVGDEIQVLEAPERAPRPATPAAGSAAANATKPGCTPGEGFSQAKESPQG